MLLFSWGKLLLFHNKKISKYNLTDELLKEMSFICNEVHTNKVSLNIYGTIL